MSPLPASDLVQSLNEPSRPRGGLPPSDLGVPTSDTAGRWNGPADTRALIQTANEATGHDPAKGPSFWDGLAMLGSQFIGQGIGQAQSADILARTIGQNPEHPASQIGALAGQEALAAGAVGTNLLPIPGAPAWLGGAAQGAARAPGLLPAIGRTAWAAGTNAAAGGALGGLTHVTDDPLEHAAEGAAGGAIFGGALHGVLGEAAPAAATTVRGGISKMFKWANEGRGTVALPAFADAPARVLKTMDYPTAQLQAARENLRRVAARARLFAEDAEGNRTNELDWDLIDEIRALLPDPSPGTLGKAGPEELLDTARAIRLMHQKNISVDTPLKAVTAEWMGRAGDITRMEAQAASHMLGPNPASANDFGKYFRMVGSAMSSFKRWADQFGNAGKFFADKVNAAQKSALLHAAPWINDVQAALKPLSAFERDRFTDIVEGNDALLASDSPALSNALDVWRNTAKAVAEKAREVGLQVKDSAGEWREFKPRDFYFPRQWNQNSLAKLGRAEQEQLFADANKSRGADSPPITDAKSFLRAMYENQGQLITQKGQWRLADVVSGNLQRSRWTDFQGYERDPRIALPIYLLKAGQALSATEHFGPQQQLMEGMLKNIERGAGRGFDLKRFLDVTRKVIGGYADPTWNDLYNLTANVEIATRLGFPATLKHFPGQLLNTVIQGGGQEAIGAMAAMAKKDPEMARLVKDTGVNIRDLLPDFAHVDPEVPGQGFMGGPGRVQQTAKNFAQFWTKAIGLQDLVRAQRAHAALTGILEAKKFSADLMAELAKPRGSAQRVKTLASWLEDLDLDPASIIRAGGELSRDQLRRAGLSKAMDTQLMGRLGDIPAVGHNQIGRFTMLFKSAAFQQGVVNKEQVWKPFIQWVDSGGLKGTPKPMVKWLVRASFDKAVTGEAIGLIRMYASGRTPEDEEEDKNKLMAVIEHANSAGMLGLWADVLEQIARPQSDQADFMANLAGPIVGEGADLAWSVGKSFTKPSLRPLAGYAVSHVPIYGRRLRKAVDTNDR